MDVTVIHIVYITIYKYILYKYPIYMCIMIKRNKNFICVDIFVCGESDALPRYIDREMVCLLGCFLVYIDS